MNEPQESAASGDERAEIALRRARSFSRMIADAYSSPVVPFLGGYDDGSPEKPLPMKQDPEIERILNRKSQG